MYAYKNGDLWFSKVGFFYIDTDISTLLCMKLNVEIHCSQQ